MKTYCARPNGLPKTPKLRFRVGDLDLPDNRARYTSSWEEEEEGAQSCPCGNPDERTAYMMADCELYKDERNVLEEDMTKIDGCDMEKFGK